MVGINHTPVDLYKKACAIREKTTATNLIARFTVPVRSDLVELRDSNSRPTYQESVKDEASLAISNKSSLVALSQSSPKAAFA